MKKGKIKKMCENPLWVPTLECPHCSAERRVQFFEEELLDPELELICYECSKVFKLNTISVENLFKEIRA